MEIILIRHTTPDIGKGICYGQADVPLKETFLQEAEIVCHDIPSGAEIIYTSPLTRCALLARHIADYTGLPIREDHRLKELNFGLWELQAWNAIDPQTLQPWMDDYVTIACPGGESYRTLADRTGAFLQSLPACQEDSVIVVTHHGVIKAMSAILLGISLEEAMALSFGYGSVTHYTIPSLK